MRGGGPVRVTEVHVGGPHLVVLLLEVSLGLLFAGHHPRQPLHAAGRRQGWRRRAGDIGEPDPASQHRQVPPPPCPATTIGNRSPQEGRFAPQAKCHANVGLGNGTCSQRLPQTLAVGSRIHPWARWCRERRPGPGSRGPRGWAAHSSHAAARLPRHPDPPLVRLVHLSEKPFPLSITLNGQQRGEGAALSVISSPSRITSTLLGRPPPSGGLVCGCHLPH